jgi:hypothetical protein
MAATAVAKIRRKRWSRAWPALSRSAVGLPLDMAVILHQAPLADAPIQIVELGTLHGTPFPHVAFKPALRYPRAALSERPAPTP